MAMKKHLWNIFSQSYSLGKYFSPLFTRMSGLKRETKSSTKITIIISLNFPLK